jgi:hypothetical protein
MSGKSLGIIAAVSLLAACGPSTNFYWGSYEATLYEKYQDSSGIEPGEELRRMLRDVEKAGAKGMKVAPGINLHIAMLYSQMGNMDAAKQFIRAEELLYPQSKPLTNSIFKKLKQ